MNPMDEGSQSKEAKRGAKAHSKPEDKGRKANGPFKSRITQEGEDCATDKGAIEINLIMFGFQDLDQREKLRSATRILFNFLLGLRVKRAARKLSRRAVVRESRFRQR